MTSEIAWLVCISFPTSESRKTNKMYALSPKQIEARLYKTYPQRLRDFYETHEIKIAWAVVILLILTLVLVYMHRVDKKYFYPVAAKWEVQEQGQVGTGSMILNANGKVQ